MKLKSVKSQVTMLMILGLVIFIVVSLVLYLSKSAINKKSKENVKRIGETSIEVQPIKDFAIKCLDKLAKDAVVLLGQQGGYIYTSQGGTIIDLADTDEGLLFIKNGNYKVSYNILPPKFSIPPYSSEAPEYSWPTFPYESADKNAQIFEGFFGVNIMPPLDPLEGPNSIKAQIEMFIDNNFNNCADFSIFKKQGYDIDMGNIKTQVTIGTKDVKVKSNIFLKIINEATKETFEVNEISTSINIRLMNIYFFVKKLIENDIKNIRFNISQTKNSGDSINVKLVESKYVDVDSDDDLIIVSDQKSLVYGKPYEYIFARRNRAPALHYIKKNILEFGQNHVITLQDLLGNLELRAEDPDEDEYDFKITPQLPKKLSPPQIKFKVEVSDDKLSDYQIITVNRI